MSVIVGVGRNMYLLLVFAGLEPPTADTVTLAAPTPEGALAVISEPETTRTCVASLVPKRTATTLTKLLPRIVTSVPLFSGPIAGKIFVTTGLGRKV
jgi:hypothetical protein